jgi:hypothetical protein
VDGRQDARCIGRRSSSSLYGVSPEHRLVCARIRARPEEERRDRIVVSILIQPVVPRGRPWVFEASVSAIPEREGKDADSSARAVFIWEVSDGTI